MLKMTELMTEEQLRGLLEEHYSSKTPLADEKGYDYKGIKYKKAPEYETLKEWDRPTTLQMVPNPKVTIVEDRVLISLEGNYIQIQRPVYDMNLCKLLKDKDSSTGRRLLSMMMDYR